MKKYNSILGGTLIVAAIFATSCSKKLEQANPNDQTSSTFWQNSADAVKGVNAAYGTLLIDGMYMRFTPALLDIRGDDIKSNSPWTAFGNIGRFALGTADGAGYGWAFASYYEGVARANQVLDNVPGITMDAGLKNRIIGEAHFLRGLYFFHLVNLFGKVALPTQSPKTNADFFVKQSTEQAGWDQVAADFKKASELLPATYTGDDIGRATKGAALGYWGKALLFNKKYAEAAVQFKAVIDLNVYDLVPNYKDNFTETAENNKESVFEVQFSRAAGGQDLGWGGIPSSGWGKTSARAITFAPRSFGWTDVQPTRSVFNEFLVEKTISNQDDPRLDATIFYNKPGAMIYGVPFATRFGGNAADLNDLFCRKYQNGDGNKPDEFDWKSGINERILRFADILLMYAECLNETSQTAAAYPLIQRVRTRVGLPNLATTMPNMTQAQMRDQLAHERLLEFCLEGHRFDDIRRWGWLSDATKLALLKSRDPEMTTYLPGRELYPIPQTEIDNNPGYSQNPSY
ncbi:MAG: RagB/SusD family nutrient uptake outer membrane protein [Bacteroidota bacterium]